jgi:hypothetical protein
MEIFSEGEYVRENCFYVMDGKPFFSYKIILYGFIIINTYFKINSALLR